MIRTIRAVAPAGTLFSAPLRPGDSLAVECGARRRVSLSRAQRRQIPSRDRSIHRGRDEARAPRAEDRYLPAVTSQAAKRRAVPQAVGADPPASTATRDVLGVRVSGHAPNRQRGDPSRVGSDGVEAVARVHGPHAHRVVPPARAEQQSGARRLAREFELSDPVGVPRERRAIREGGRLRPRRRNRRRSRRRRSRRHSRRRNCSPVECDTGSITPDAPPMPYLR